MDRKREILNFVRDKRLNVVEELHEKELRLLDITTTLSVRKDFPLVMDDCCSLLHNYCVLLAVILNTLASLNEIEEFLLRTW